MSVPDASGSAQACYLRELIRLRTQAGLTPQELAERLGVTENTVKRGEAGSRRVGVVELQRWAFACGSTLADFARRLDARNRQ